MKLTKIARKFSQKLKAKHSGDKERSSIDCQTQTSPQDPTCDYVEGDDVSSSTDEPASEICTPSWTRIVDIRSVEDLVFNEESIADLHDQIEVSEAVTEMIGRVQRRILEEQEREELDRKERLAVHQVKKQKVLLKQLVLQILERQKGKEEEMKELDHVPAVEEYKPILQEQEEEANLAQQVEADDDSTEELMEEIWDEELEPETEATQKEEIQADEPQEEAVEERIEEAQVVDTTQQQVHSTENTEQQEIEEAYEEESPQPEPKPIVAELSQDQLITHLLSTLQTTLTKLDTALEPSSILSSQIKGMNQGSQYMSALENLARVYSIVAKQSVQEYDDVAVVQGVIRSEMLGKERNMLSVPVLPMQAVTRGSLVEDVQLHSYACSKIQSVIRSSLRRDEFEYQQRQLHEMKLTRDAITSFMNDSVAKIIIHHEVNNIIERVKLGIDAELDEVSTPESIVPLPVVSNCNFDQSDSAIAEKSIPREQEVIVPDKDEIEQIDSNCDQIVMITPDNQTAVDFAFADIPRFEAKLPTQILPPSSYEFESGCTTCSIM